MKTILSFFATMAVVVVQFNAAPIPLHLSRPDGQPGNASKPVKVYILAGQSNMVGMGDISGAQPPNPSVFLSADPAVISGVMPVGTSRTKSACRWIWKNRPALTSHGVYQSADAAAPAGAKVSVYKGAYDPKVDYSTLKSFHTEVVALGTTAAEISSIEGAHTPIVKAFIDVPASGNYMVHVGFGDSTYALAALDGKEVYRKDLGGKPDITKVALESGKRYPLEITYFKNGSAALWLEQVDLEGKGDLDYLTKKAKKFPYLIDDEGNWTTRNDVYFQEARVAAEGKGSPLNATSNGRSIGPELGFGHVMGTYLDEQVLLIKTAMGNRSLGFDFRPPSSGRNDPENNYEGLEYRLMIKGVRQTLDHIDKVVPGYKGQGYEIAGFGWFQGHKDSGSSKEDYEKNLVNLIQDLRKDLNAPKMPAVVASVGFHGYRLMTGNWKGVWEAQMAVGDPKQHPELAGSVASVDTRDFWREIEESPRSQDYHYNRNPETYLLIGEAMGRAMVRLQGGEAEEIPKSDREARVAAEIIAEAAKTEPTQEQVAASNAAIEPMILDGMMDSFVTNPRYQPALQVLLKGEQKKPSRTPEYLDDTIDDAVAYMQAAGIDDYDWKPMLADMKNGTWEYIGFNLPNSPYKEKSEAPEKGKVANAVVIKAPAGMENWFAPAFDAKKAGWKSGQAPFGMQMEETVPEEISWISKYPLYPTKRTMPKTILSNDVMLMRGTFELPAVKEGHRYRIRVDGSIHDNSGEGFQVYINGKLLGQVDKGVTAWRRQGLRGSHVWQEFLEDFKGGKVTIAVANYPMNDWSAERYIPAIGPLSVWVEEQKIPELK